MAYYYEDIYEVIDSLEVSKKWKGTFKKIYTVYYQNFSGGKYKNIHFWAPSPLISVLGIVDKWQFHCLFNFWALFFGPLWYFAKGMYVKGVILSVIWFYLFTVNDMAAYLVVLVHIYCAILANSDFFILKVAKSEKIKQNPMLFGDYVKESYFNRIVDSPKRTIGEPLAATLLTLAIIAITGFFLYNDIVSYMAIEATPVVCKTPEGCKAIVTEQQTKMDVSKAGKKYSAAYKMACAYANNKQTKKAMEFVDIALKDNPKFVPARLLKASLYFGAKYYRESAIEYKKALRDNKRLKSINFNIGRCYYRLKEYSTALNYFKEATKKYPFNPTYFEIQGYTRAQLGYKNEAKKDLERAKNLYNSSSNTEHQKRVQVIEKYMKRL